MFALVVGDAAPGFVAGLAGFGDGVEAPEFFAGLGVVGGDYAGFAGDLEFAGAAGEDFAAGDDGAGGLLGGEFAVILDAGFPGQLAVGGVYAVDEIVGAEVDDFVVVDGDVAVLERGAGEPAGDVVGDGAFVFPG